MIIKYAPEATGYWSYGNKWVVTTPPDERTQEEKDECKAYFRIIDRRNERINQEARLRSIQWAKDNPEAARERRRRSYAMDQSMLNQLAGVS